MVLTAVAALCGSAYLFFSGAIGLEFLPHLDEGALWVRGTLAPGASAAEAIRVSTRAHGAVLFSGSSPVLRSGGTPR